MFNLIVEIIITTLAGLATPQGNLAGNVSVSFLSPSLLSVPCDGWFPSQKVEKSGA